MNKQIEEMANIIKAVKYAPFNYGEPTYTVGVQMADFVFDLIAEALYNAGYHNEKETAREILRIAFSDDCDVEGTWDGSAFERIIKEKYGVEVE